MSSYIEEKLKEFNNWYDDLDDGLYQADKSEIRDFIEQALQEQEERIIKKIKSLPRYTFLTDKREFTTADVISREAVIKILNQDKLL